jgi:hypothetical protein
MSGCDTIKELWAIAIKCNVQNPGIKGVLSRTHSFIECGNVKSFMTMATMKCWHERNLKDLLIIEDNKKTVDIEERIKFKE